MKIRCDQRILTKALNTVYKAVTTRTTIPILKGILIETLDNETIKLAASDLDISIEKKCISIVDEPGAIVVPSKLFTDIIRKLPDEEIEIEEINNTVTIRCKSSEFVIVGQSADEFPNISEINEKEKLLMDKEIFKRMIKRTAFAASNDESRGILTGVLLEINQDTFTMAALDGFRLAIAREQIVGNVTLKIVIASRILNEINKIMLEDEKEEDFILLIDDRKIVINMGNTKITSRLLEGDFINYKDIIPKISKCNILTNRHAFLESIERASLLVKEGKNNLIKMKIEETSAIITSRSEEGNVKEEIFIEKEGEGLEIGFNSKYILDVLKVVEDEEIFMEFNTNVTPCLVKPKTGNAFEYLILPVRISTN